MAPQDLLSKHDLRPHEPACRVLERSCPRRNPRPSTRLLVHCHCFDGFAATLENGNASYEAHCDSPGMAVVEAYPYVCQTNDANISSGSESLPHRAGGHKRLRG